MSIQINFFADDADQRKLNSFLRETIQPLYGIRAERGKQEELAPTLVKDDSLFRSGRKLFLAPEWALKRIVYFDVGDVYPGQKVADENLSPILEYRPCFFEKDGSLRRGRFYFTYPGKIPAEYKKLIRRIFAWVRKESVPHPIWKSSRIFESASKNVKMLRQCVGPPEPNPLFEETGSRLT